MRMECKSNVYASGSVLKKKISGQLEIEEELGKFPCPPSEEQNHQTLTIMSQQATKPCLAFEVQWDWIAMFSSMYCFTMYGGFSFQRGIC